MNGAPAADALLALRAAVLTLVRAESEEIMAQRPLAVLLVLASIEGRHTVRDMAASLSIPRVAVSRAMQRLAIAGLAHRVPDPADRGSTLLHATPRGRALVRRMAEAAAAAQGPGP